VSKAFAKVVEWLHAKRHFNAGMLSEKEPRALVEETFNVLQTPLKDLSISREIPPELTAALEENVFIFSGFKTYHELKEASMLLKDENGGFKPFDRFRQDVEAIDSTYNRNYLAAEYEFAVASSQMAVKWKELEKDGDRYDLQYRTAGDDRVRPEHAALNGITLPPSDKFWDEYYPPNGWRCRCTAVQVRRGKYPESDPAEAAKAGERATTQIGKDGTNKGKIFRFNPGKQEKIFPPKHPYFPKGCGNCEFKFSYNPNDEKCIACKAIHKCLERAEQLKQINIKTYDNGGSLDIYPYAIPDRNNFKDDEAYNRAKEDFDRIKEAADHFAKLGKKAVITPKFDGGKFCPDYVKIYGSLKGSQYHGKCPDFMVDGVFYEHEGFTSDKPKKAIKNMLKHGLIQSDRLILEKPQISVDYIKERIKGKIKEGYSVKEVWIKDGNLIYNIDF